MVDFASARRKMVDNQLRTSNITDRRLLAAMDDVPRELFVPEARRDLAYTDIAQPLGEGRALASPAPFARLVQLAEIRHTDRVLDVGAATGYSSAVLARLGAEITALESDAGLAVRAREALAASGAANVSVVEGPLDGSSGLAGTYDVIVVEGTVASAPAALFPRLAQGGRLVALIRSGATASVHVFVRSGDEVASRTEFNATLPALARPAAEAFVF